jgi:hypothetical protein
MRRPYLDTLSSFGIDPSADGAAGGKIQSVNFIAFDNCQFQIAPKWSASYRFPRQALILELIGHCFRGIQIAVWADKGAFAGVWSDSYYSNEPHRRAAPPADWPVA